MRIAFAGQKGGSGKSTCAIACAAEWHARGKRVLLVDADPQGTALTWGEVAAEEGNDAPSVVRMGDNVRQQLPRLAEGFEVVVIDLPGRSDKTQRSALMISDAAILPCGPSAADAWALAESAELVRGAQELRDNLKAAVLITRKQARTTIGDEAREALAQVDLPIMETELGFRVAYQEFPAAGVGVKEMSPGSAAAEEISQLVDELEVLCGRA